MECSYSICLLKQVTALNYVIGSFDWGLLAKKSLYKDFSLSGIAGLGTERHSKFLADTYESKVSISLCRRFEKLIVCFILHKYIYIDFMLNVEVAYMILSINSEDDLIPHNLNTLKRGIHFYYKAQCLNSLFSFVKCMHLQILI